jgi:4-hydroxybenzoate polyprenyltransferase
MIPFLKLIRYKNLLMVLLTMVLTKYALISSFLSQTNLTNSEFFLLSLSILLITAGGYIINYIYDIDVDKINKPEKVIVSHSISLKNAWVSYCLLSSIGLVVGIYLSFEKQLNFFSLYFIASIILLFLYSRFLKRLPLIGNLTISLLVSLTIFLTYQFDDSMLGFNRDGLNSLFLSIIIFYYLLFSFFSTLVRELIKDIEDINGDHALKMKTLPIILGIKRTRNIVIGLSFLILFFLFLLLKEASSSEEYVLSFILLIESLLFLGLIYKLWNAQTKNEFHFLSNLMKVIMLVGILSMTLFKFT